MDLGAGDREACSLIPPEIRLLLPACEERGFLTALGKKAVPHLVTPEAFTSWDDSFLTKNRSHEN